MIRRLVRWLARRCGMTARTPAEDEIFFARNLIEMVDEVRLMERKFWRKSSASDGDVAGIPYWIAKGPRKEGEKCSDES